MYLGWQCRWVLDAAITLHGDKAGRGVAAPVRAEGTDARLQENEAITQGTGQPLTICVWKCYYLSLYVCGSVTTSHYMCVEVLLPLTICVWRYLLVRRLVTVKGCCHTPIT